MSYLTPDGHTLEIQFDVNISEASKLIILDPFWLMDIIGLTPAEKNSQN